MSPAYPNAVDVARQVKDWKPALKLWQKIRALDPDDAGARRKINELSVEDHIARGNYRR